MPEFKLPFGIRLLRGPTELEKAKSGPLEEYVEHLLASSVDGQGYIGAERMGFKGRQQAFFTTRGRLDDLYTIAFSVAVIRTAILALRGEIFRRGLEWKPRWTVKCTNEECGEESSENIEECKLCKAPTRLPDPKQRERFEQFLGRANVFGQSLMDVLKECEDDVNIADDAYLLLFSQYIYKDKKKKFERRVLQIQRLDPATVEFDLDEAGLPERKTGICPNHRMEPLDPRALGQPCQHCGMLVLMAMYKYTHEGKVYYFTRDEIIHWSKYAPSKTYGYSPILSIQEKSLTIAGMDRFLFEQYYRRQLPPGIITSPTDDVPGLTSEIRAIRARMKTDPSYVPWIAVKAGRGAAKTEFTRTGYTPDELKYVDVRQELRERISSLFGVSNIWMGSTEGIGGLSKETQQLVVMSRVVEAAQGIYNDKVFPAMLAAFGITDWLLMLLSPEEMAEETRLALEERKASIAVMHANLGFMVSIDPDGKFVYKRPETAEEEAQVVEVRKALAGGDGWLSVQQQREEMAKGWTEVAQNVQRVVEELQKHYDRVGIPQIAMAAEPLVQRLAEELEKRSLRVGIPQSAMPAEREKPSRQIGAARIVGAGGGVRPARQERPAAKHKAGQHRHAIPGHPAASRRWHSVDQKHRAMDHSELKPEEIELRE